MFLAHILGARPSGPRCCPPRINFTTALGTLQIMVGLFNVGLGPGRTSTHPGDLSHLGAAYWLGAVFITSGIVSLVFCPSACWVGFTAVVNVLASIFAVVAVVLYAFDLDDASVTWMCNNSDDNCVYVAYFAQKLLTDMDVTLIVLAVLQLCVCVTMAVFCIRALCGCFTHQQVEDDSHESMVKEVMTSPGA